MYQVLFSRSNAEIKMYIFPPHIIVIKPISIRSIKHNMGQYHADSWLIYRISSWRNRLKNILEDKKKNQINIMKKDNQRESSFYTFCLFQDTNKTELTVCFHFIVCTSSSCMRWASFPLALIFFGSSFWYLK